VSRQHIRKCLCVTVQKLRKCRLPGPGSPNFGRKSGRRWGQCLASCQAQGARCGAGTTSNLARSADVLFSDRDLTIDAGAQQRRHYLLHVEKRSNGPDDLKKRSVLHASSSHSAAFLATFSRVVSMPIVSKTPLCGGGTSFRPVPKQHRPDRTGPVHGQGEGRVRGRNGEWSRSSILVEKTRTTHEKGPEPYIDAIYWCRSLVRTPRPAGLRVAENAARSTCLARRLGGK